MPVTYTSSRTPERFASARPLDFYAGTEIAPTRSSASCAKGSVWMSLVIPERVAELVGFALEAQLLSKLAVLVFEFRSRLLQVAQLFERFHLIAKVRISSKPRENGGHGLIQR